MRAMSLLIRLVLTQGGGALAEDTPSPALLVLNKRHRGSTRPSELAIVDPGSGRVVARIPTGIESHEVAVSPDAKLAVVTNTEPSRQAGGRLQARDRRGARRHGVGRRTVARAASGIGASREGPMPGISWIRTPHARAVADSHRAQTPGPAAEITNFQVFLLEPDP
jgi:hypothetical protein